MAETPEVFCYAIDSDGNPITFPMKRDGDVWRGTAPARCQIVDRSTWLIARARQQFPSSPVEEN